MKHEQVSRRRFLHAAGLGTSAALLATIGGERLVFASTEAGVETTQANAATRAAATLPPLPYAYNALEPFIDEMTMRIHHTRHHAAYVTNLNTALNDYPDLQNRDTTELIANLSDLPQAIQTAVRNNGGGHVNHAIFWAIMSPQGGGEPNGQLRKEIEATFGTVGYMKALVNDAALRRFGSGWGWLVLNANGKLEVTSTPNQDSPYMVGQTPLLGIDVWEHAYYLKYQNRRADYLNAWWNVVNWHAVGQRFDKARG
ncbi:MAG: superoxide dismutase [Chloroflexota bacterium]|nr:superoxide dismutase [Chloroflexota bacterium]